VAGTHGKTTTTSLTGWLLTHGHTDPTVLVGGIALNFGSGGASYRVGQGREFVIEGDEYDSAFFDKTAKFLKYLPDVAVINNIEFDHADIYADLDAVTLAFRRLVNLVPRARAAAARRRQSVRRGAAPARRQPGRDVRTRPAQYMGR
jgi:UDP-N-acetylmuramate: L-alanyl-gamma-D-glutamyl-meso-diaminopimelate ligase